MNKDSFRGLSLKLLSFCTRRVCITICWKLFNYEFCSIGNFSYGVKYRNSESEWRSCIIMYQFYLFSKLNINKNMDIARRAIYVPFGHYVNVFWYFQADSIRFHHLNRNCTFKPIQSRKKYCFIWTCTYWTHLVGWWCFVCS